MEKEQLLKLQKVAKLVLANVPQNQIAAACGVTEGRISQLINMPEYKNIEQELAVQKIEENELINQGWDGVEALGVKHTLIALKNNPDDDFALRAAIVANKAIRRGSINNKPINPQSAGVRAIIHLNPTFVDKLQQNFSIDKQENKALVEKEKDSDFMPAAAVHNLLGAGSKISKVMFDSSIPVTSPQIDEDKSNETLLNLENFGENTGENIGEEH